MKMHTKLCGGLDILKPHLNQYSYDIITCYDYLEIRFENPIRIYFTNFDKRELLLCGWEFEERYDEDIEEWVQIYSLRID